MSARRAIFNNLVAPLVGGRKTHEEAAQMLDDFRDENVDECRRADHSKLLRIQAALLDLHPEDRNPKHGCCTPPATCLGHRPECVSREHHLGGQTPWPCRTLRAAGITSRADADEIRRLTAEKTTEGSEAA